MTQPRLLGDRYELDGVVGRGGMAEVYRARDLRLDRIVAIKTLRTDLARDQTFQARFRREAQSAASLNNPSIVAVYDTGEDLSSGVPVPFIVMEYVDGRTVRDLLIEGHRLLPERTLEIVLGVLRALEYSHQAGIVHRDIKPGNVMVTRNGDIKVMDFGIARAMSDAQATMTQTAQVIGTAQYLSPEQARGERVDARSDLYSTGCLMYELLTGRPPFTGDSPVAIAYQHVRENPIPPSRLDPSLPPWADSIVLKAMAKSPNDRYQSAAEMAADIQRAASGMQVAASMQPPTRAENYYDYQQRTQHMGPQTMMGAAPTTVSPYQTGGFQTGYQQPYPYGDGGYNGNGEPEKQGGGRRWIPWLIAGLVAVAAIVVAVILLQGHGGGNTFVPTGLNGETQSQAVSDLTAAGLKADVIQQVSADTVKGHVIRTDPAGGDSIAKNGTVKVYVSTGAGTIKIPDVTKLSQQDAENQLKNAGFTNVQTQTDDQSTLPTGEVDHTQPVPGTPIPSDQQITLFVSGGSVKVPDVISGGLTQSEAQTVLNGDGFNNIHFIVIAAQNGQMVEPGTCYFQNPTAGTVKPTSTLITVYVQPAQTSTPTPSTSTTPTTSTSPTTTPTDTATATPTDTATATPTDTGSTPPGPGNNG
ncbi:Stk1 family PASTA domain-containing Ser/Thr kinase [Trebonia kvetii]|uniref:non-specific serine/threonine protein kinase n=1 Tax=Trebonia kvetii TaxID=2480626 RepID=A0A6P2BUA4_9ACTN|nr:Stk1 family PASTA domain-containing Ser/Thr kinase [Trebonia kvetii]TVZ01675.1 Stk1 family PASTA domain-containing Ser/Thr kinase [Trebonia kvetii]